MPCTVSFLCICLQFPLLPYWRVLGDVGLEHWATGLLDLWVFHFCALDTESGSYFTQAWPVFLKIYPQPAQYHRTGFQVLFEKKKKKEKSRKRWNKRDYVISDAQYYGTRLLLLPWYHSPGLRSVLIFFTQFIYLFILQSALSYGLRFTLVWLYILGFYHIYLLLTSNQTKLRCQKEKHTKTFNKKAHWF